MSKKIELVKKNLQEVKKGLKGFTERIVLLSIICFVWVFLDLFQNRLPGFCAVFTLLILLTLYAFYMQIAFKHKKRKEKGLPKVQEKNNYHPFVSILIPAHNEENVIENTIKNIMELDYENYELIVIDDRSKDNTAKVLIELEKEYSRLNALIRAEDAFPGKSAVLNEALAFAKGEVILVFDADARIEPDFLTRLLPDLEPKDIGAVQARKVIINRNENFLTRCQDNELALDTHFQVGRDAVKGAVELRGNGELIKRKALEDINGWNNYTITDDLDMSTRMHIKGWDIRFNPDVCVYEEGVLTPLALLKQRRRWIEGAIRRYLENFIPILFSKDMSLRTGLDMTAYIAQFILPFAALSEIIMQIIKHINGFQNSVLSSLILSTFICIFYMIGLSYSIRRYNKISIGKSIIQGFETSVYFIVLWFPLVMFIVFKIIFAKKNMDWGKTTHGLTKIIENLRDSRDDIGIDMISSEKEKEKVEV